MEYLDQSDIEELGWVRDEDNDRADHEAYFFECKEGAWLGFTLLKHDESQEVIIQQTHSKISNFDITRFHGNIKNFNNLQTLMKWLEIA